MNHCWQSFSNSLLLSLSFRRDFSKSSFRGRFVADAEFSTILPVQVITKDAGARQKLVQPLEQQSPE